MTKQRFLMLLALIMLLALAVSGPSFSAKMPPGAFITSPVSDGADLAGLVEKDSVTAKRYTKHYGMTSDELAKYFRDNLTVYTLPKTQTFTAFYVTASGRVIEHKKTLKVGTKVLVTSTGNPVIELRCGNPLTKVLPVVMTQAKPVIDTAPPVEPPVAEPTTPVVEVAEAPVEPVIVADVPTEAAVPLPVEETVLGIPMELPVENIVPDAFASSTSWVVPTLLGAGAVGALVGGGGDKTLVPEPGSLLVLGMGATALAAQFYKRRTR